jgi:predicted nucleic acid-binding protein
VPLYLADTSIWGWANSRRRRDITDKLALRFERGEVATCAPIALEVMHRARDGAEYDALFETLLAPLDWLPLTDQMSGRAVQVQRELAQVTHGNHLRPAIDFLTATIAEAAGGDVVFWFFDKDLEIICRHTGQPYEAESAAAA